MGGYAGLPNGYVPGGTASLADIITGMGRQKGEAAEAQARPALVQAETAAQQANTRQTDVDTQIKQQVLRDQQIQRQMVTDAGSMPPAGAQPSTGGTPTPGSAPAAAPSAPSYLSDPQAFFMEGLKRGMSPKSAAEGAQQLFTLRQNALKLTPDQVAAEDANHKIIGGSLQGYLENPNDQAYAQFYQNAVQREPDLAHAMPAPGQGVTPSQQDLAYVTGHLHMLDSLLATSKRRADIANVNSEALQHGAETKKAGAEQAKIEAETPGVAAKSTREKLITDLMQKAQAAQQNGQHPIDAVMPPELDKQANASYKGAYDTAMASGGPEAASKIAEAAAQHAAKLSEASNPQVRAGEVAKAVAIEKATGPLKVAQQVQAEIEKAKQAPGAFSSVVEPAVRTRAIGDYEKASNEYAEKVGAAQQLGDFIAAAQSGNKSAPGLIPIAAVRQLVNRVNRQELESVSGSAGSIFDRIQGKIGGLTEGEPIPPAILKDLKTISGTIAEAAKRTYGNKVKVINSTYGSKAQPIDFGEQKSVPAISNQADYDKLPKGAQYTWNGVPHVKQ